MVWHTTVSRPLKNPHISAHVSAHSPLVVDRHCFYDKYHMSEASVFPQWTASFRCDPAAALPDIPDRLVHGLFSSTRGVCFIPLCLNATGIIKSHGLTWSIGAALSWIDRMCVMLFLANCSRSLASEHKQKHLKKTINMAFLRRFKITIAIGAQTNL